MKFNSFQILNSTEIDIQHAFLPNYKNGFNPDISFPFSVQKLDMFVCTNSLSFFVDKKHHMNR